jgi:hypothetical protein
LSRKVFELGDHLWVLVGIFCSMKGTGSCRKSSRQVWSEGAAESRDVVALTCIMCGPGPGSLNDKT